MNVLDENIIDSQRQLLKSWRVPIRQIGYETGHKGLQDHEIIPLLLKLRRPTFFTRDLGFYDQRLCHRSYCLVSLAVNEQEVAVFARRLLRHREFDTQKKRMGRVIHISQRNLSVWRLHTDEESFFNGATDKSQSELALGSSVCPLENISLAFVA